MWNNSNNKTNDIIYTIQLKKNKNDKYRTTTTMEWQALDLGQVHKECGLVEHVYEHSTNSFVM